MGRDGVPIHGPYGRDGRLVDVNELDECNGRWEMNASGEKEYHYVWSVAEPFLPQCFRLRPAQAILVVYVELLEVELRNVGATECHAGLPAPLTGARGVIPKRNYLGAYGYGGWLVHQRLLGEFPRQHSQKLAEVTPKRKYNGDYRYRSEVWTLNFVLRKLNCRGGSIAFFCTYKVFDSGNGDSNDDGVTDVFNPCAAGQVGFPFICQSRNVEKDCDSQFVDNYNAQVFLDDNILTTIREFEWIDDLTRDIFVASFIYFPNAVLRLRVGVKLSFVDSATGTFHELMNSTLPSLAHLLISSYTHLLLLRLDFAFENTGRIVADRRINTHRRAALDNLLSPPAPWHAVKARRRITYDCLLTVLLLGQCDLCKKQVQL
ncbi:hypothetical protein AK812_SmicGene32210 [Symbiodinium microadriaticum]|uniref:Uncharacterized protein n=1 Tax=Symbiodinium microadriaticum TaxID=2951 RepID=A0A1Q9CUQ2_SYMMI|nr:hypothetical protein AK812_SmicGene32210 [Symbiodinium microadriaticum]